MRLIVVLLAAICSLAGLNPLSDGRGIGAQNVDPAFNAAVSAPAFTSKHPKVLFDVAHNNTEQPNGRYKPFADLIANDGYKVTANTSPFSKKVLDGYDLLVVVNASGPSAERDRSAFSGDECDAVRAWVANGGGLLLICDQAPFSSAAADLAKRFELELTQGFTIDSVHHDKDSGDETELVFTRENGLLADHPITRGRNQSEQLSRVITYTGTSLRGPAQSVAFLKLSESAQDVFPSKIKPASADQSPPDPEKKSAAGKAQGIALVVGKGRIVALTEAAMLTAQVAPKGFRFGMNVTGFDNRQLALNIVHWLSGILK